MSEAAYEAPQPDLSHILRLTDDVGIMQHAKFIVPDRYHGYCTDDNARALIAVLMAQDILPDSEALARLACTYMSFLHHAFNEEKSCFRNFMGYARQWLEEVGAEDAHGRAIWGLGEAVALAESADIRTMAQLLFEKALSTVTEFSSPRSWAYSLVGIHAYLRQLSGDSEVRRIREILAGKLLRLYQENASADWCWIEPAVTYANGKICQALILSGQSMSNNDMLQAGLSSLDWLMAIQTDPKGHFVPVGNKGWYARGGEKARFDQQPVEALNMIQACQEAFEATKSPKWFNYAQCCLEWFLGRNDMNAFLYDHKTGGCRDGLQADGPNRNQGAESTLACFLSLLHLTHLRRYQASLKAAADSVAPSLQPE